MPYQLPVKLNLSSDLWLNKHIKITHLIAYLFAGDNAIFYSVRSIKVTVHQGCSYPMVGCGVSP
jgi:hypothetical protein